METGTELGKNALKALKVLLEERNPWGATAGREAGSHIREMNTFLSFIPSEKKHQSILNNRNGLI